MQKTFEQFQLDCINNICNRGTIISKRCATAAKQTDCYAKWTAKKSTAFSKNNEDEQWVKVRAFVRKRDKVCRLWLILTAKEQVHILQKFHADYKMLSMLDVAHIKAKGSHPNLYYDPNNMVLIRRYFHTLLDTFKCPVTQNAITQEYREKWLDEARTGIRTIPEVV
jgi:hypothetical protein